MLKRMRRLGTFEKAALLARFAFAAPHSFALPSTPYRIPSDREYAPVGLCFVLGKGGNPTDYIEDGPRDEQLSRLLKLSNRLFLSAVRRSGSSRGVPIALVGACLCNLNS